ncbi:MAG: hypothetical protein LH473_07085, partial [Chitinophagales bacterium]|nr:hypothetical protein [Chitinophagales bacterium]
MKKLLLLLTFTTLLSNYTFAQYPLISINDLQLVDPQTLSNGKDTSLYYGDTVQVEGIVNFDPCDYGQSTTGSRNGTWLQTAGGGAWNGIHVLIDPGALGYSGTLNDLNNAVQFIDNFQVGNKVKCTGILSSFGLTNAPVPGNSQILI